MADFTNVYGQDMGPKGLNVQGANPGMSEVYGGGAGGFANLLGNNPDLFGGLERVNQQHAIHREISERQFAFVREEREIGAVLRPSEYAQRRRHQCDRALRVDRDCGEER